MRINHKLHARYPQKIFLEISRNSIQKQVYYSGARGIEKVLRNLRWQKKLMLLKPTCLKWKVANGLSVRLLPRGLRRYLELIIVIFYNIILNYYLTKMKNRISSDLFIKSFIFRSTNLYKSRLHLTVTHFEAMDLLSVQVEVFNFFLPDSFSIKQCFYRRSPTAHFTLMRSLMIIIMQPIIQIFLQFVKCYVNFLAKCNLIKLI